MYSVHVHYVGAVTGFLCAFVCVHIFQLVYATLMYKMKSTVLGNHPQWLLGRVEFCLPLTDLELWCFGNGDLMLPVLLIGVAVHLDVVHGHRYRYVSGTLLSFPRNQTRGASVGGWSYCRHVGLRCVQCVLHLHTCQVQSVSKQAIV